MKKPFTIFLLFICQITKSQNVFIGIIKNEETKQPIQSVTIQLKSLKLSAKTNEEGLFVLKNIPAGKYDVEISSIGYKKREQSLHFPLASTDTIQLFLQVEVATLDEVTVNSTRSGRSVKNTPTRVEVIGEDEIHEEATMRPGDIKMLLAESTGIQTQQTSATSGNASIRIQGLDGRYTQILKDGFPIWRLRSKFTSVSVAKFTTLNDLL